MFGQKCAVTQLINQYLLYSGDRN